MEVSTNDNYTEERRREKDVNSLCRALQNRAFLFEFEVMWFRDPKKQQQKRQTNVSYAIHLLLNHGLSETIFYCTISITSICNHRMDYENFFFTKQCRDCIGGDIFSKKTDWKYASDWDYICPSYFPP